MANYQDYYKIKRSDKIFALNRNRIKKLEQLKKKPAFKVGIVHHKYYLPSIKDSSIFTSVKSSLKSQKQIAQPKIPPRRIKRATEKRLLSKQEVANTEVPQKQNILEKKREKPVRKNNKKDNVKKTEQKSFAPSDYKFTAPSGITGMPLFGRVNLILTPARDSKSMKSEIKEKTSSSNKKSESLDQEYNETTNINNKMSDTSIISSSLEGLNNCEITNNVLRNSTLSDDSNHSKMILSPGNISAITTDKITPKDSSNNKIKISFSKNYFKEKGLKESFKNINISSTNNTPPLTKNNATLTETNSIKDPAYFSPYIVSSRGKSKARKEQQIRRGIGSPNDDIPTKETVMQTLNLSIEDEERTAQYFAFLLRKEINRLNELINKWTDIQKELDITEDAQYLINQAIGQTRLLINKKFDRFQRLVSDCESGKGEMLVTCRDLQGFWDMMYMEIQNCDSRFEALEKLRSRGWKEEEEIVAKVKPKRKVVSKKKVVPKKKSSVQAFILAAKQKMKNNTNNSNRLQENENEVLTSVNNIDIENKNIVINSATKEWKSTNCDDILSIGVKNRNSRDSLFKNNLSLETCKTPITIMKISQMYKMPKVELDDSISYINSKQTPNRSILKRPDDVPINNIYLTRPTQKVNFNDNVVSNELSIDEEAQDSLAVRLARIDNYDLDNEYTSDNIRIERRLDFDNSLQNLESDLQLHAKQLSSSTVFNKEDDVLLNHKTDKQFITNVCLPENQNILNISLEKSPKNKTKMKTLRNRTIVTENSTNRISTRSRTTDIKDSIDKNDENNQKENKSPRKSRKQSRKKAFDVEEIEVNVKQNICVTPVNVKKELRRSSRKSVKFNAEDCEACEEAKFTLPLTPYYRCSKGRLSFLQENSTPVKPPSPNRDLISWDSPRIPARVRRSTRNISNKHIL
ncbi:hypothetical protein M0802_005526 [Mischocyttarus mexicanus]|nr:hypothetical protein M0802_005526 [Mischocyttarus mexicanus]